MKIPYSPPACPVVGFGISSAEQDLTLSLSLSSLLNYSGPVSCEYAYVALGATKQCSFLRTINS